MKYALRFVGVVGFGIILAGCDYNRPKLTSQMPDNQLYTVEGNQLDASGNYTLHAYDKLVLSGAVNVTLKSDQAQNVIHASGNPAALNQLKIVQRKDELFVGSSGRHRVNVEVDQAATKTPLTLVLLKGSRTKSDNSNFLIQKIVAVSNAQLNLYWLNTSHLNIIAKDKCKLFLAGVATHLDVTAMDDAEVNGKYLRVQESYVTAMGSASVGVNVKSALGTQSLGNASVYYYKDPEFTGVYLKNSGSALRMKGISGPSNNLLD